MNGIEIMLKSMGIDTSALRDLLDPTNVCTLLNRVEKMCDNIDEIKLMCLRVEIKLGTLPEDISMQLIADHSTEAFQQALEYVRSYNNGDNGNAGCYNGNNGNNADRNN